MNTLILEQGDIKRIFEIVGSHEIMTRVIGRLHDGLRALGNAESTNSPLRMGFPRTEPTPGIIEVMPHHVPGAGLTIKTVSYSPRNRGSQLPTVVGSVFRFDDESGALLAVVDGVLLTAVRTGAASAIASRYLSATHSEVVGIIGAGAQAVTQLHGVGLTRSIKRVLIFDIRPEHSATLRRRMSDLLDAEFEIVSVEEILHRADIIVTATSIGLLEGPVFPDTGRNRPHLHVNAIGGGRDREDGTAARPAQARLHLRGPS